jgi:hypothetical protein
MAAIADFAHKFGLVLKACNLSRGRRAQTVGIDKSVRVEEIAGSVLAAGKSQPYPRFLDWVSKNLRPAGTFYVNGSFAIEIGNPNPPLWVGVHRSFGPIYIEQIGIEWTNASAGLLVDGSVKVGPMTVQAYELGLEIPFRELLAPDHWALDLKGLAVGFQSGPLSIAGGLAKNPGPPVEYDGMLSCDIAGRGFTVVGGYARPKDGQGEYTSLFIFVSLPIPLGGPPFLFVTGLGGGAGYNRQLRPPTDLAQIPSFFLVAAIDDVRSGRD